MEDGAVKKDEPVRIDAPPAASVTVDPQNPIPEPSFFWRRVLTFLMSFGLLGLAWHNAIQLHDLGISGDLLTLAKWCIALNGFVLLCYFVGPSAAELTAMIQSARIIKQSLSVAGEASKQPESAGIPAAQRDSAPPVPGDTGQPAFEPDAAPTATAETDAAPTARQP